MLVKSQTEAVILAGGLGTRLRPFTITIPKPLLPLANKPIAEVVLTQLKNAGFNKICISLGYMAPLFQAVFGDGSRLGICLDYVIEETPLGTAGALSLVPNLADSFLVLNGDTLTNLDYSAFLNNHKASKAAATIFCHKVDEYIDYGVVEFDQKGVLQAYNEKPTRNYFVSTGIYALNKASIANMNSTSRLDMPDLLINLRNENKLVNCYTQDNAYWKDIGRFDHYETASQDFDKSPDRFL